METDLELIYENILVPSWELVKIWSCPGNVSSYTFKWKK